MVLAAAIAAIGASLAALPHPRDQAATADVPPPPEEDMPTVTVTGVRPHTLNGHASIDPLTSNGGQPGRTDHGRIEDYLNLVGQVLGMQPTGVTSPIGAAYARLRSEGLHRAQAGDDGRSPGAGTQQATGTAHFHGAGPGKAQPALSEHIGSLAAGASSAYGPHAVSGMLDFIANPHSSGIRIASSYGFYSQEGARRGRSSPQPVSSGTFARRISTTLQLLSVTPGQRPET
jgi:hypothetical protein